jgi:O-antigen/teichoic acid export membrane protein
MLRSLIERYLFATSTNFIRAILSFITGLLIARGLGVEEYGIFSFLIASFGAILSLVDFGTSSAFFTFISQRLRPHSFFFLFLAWIFLILCGSLLLLILLIPASMLDFIWSGQSRMMLSLAFLSVFLKTYVWNIVIQIAESQRFTKISQSLSLAVTGLHLSLVLALLYFDTLSISILFTIIIFEFLLALLIAYVRLPILYSDERIDYQQTFQDYLIFCMPLMPYIFLQMLMKFSDTWLLQKFGGSAQQAYYALAMQFSVICIIATSSFVKILWKEVAEAHENGDEHYIERMYLRSSRILFTGAAIFCCGLAPLAPEIILISLGEDFLPGAFIMSLMFLYPIHQTLGQINGSMYFSLGMTKMHSIIGIIFMISSTITVYFLLAPKLYIIPGFELGALGVAIKMLAMQFIFTTVTSAYLCYHKKWNVSLKYQFFLPILFLVLSLASNSFISSLPVDPINPILEIALSLFIYFSLVSMLVYTFPKILGFDFQGLKKILLR